MLMWFATTLRSYPKIALFLSLAIGYYVGGFSYRGFALGAVTSTLLAAVVIGQIGITVSPNVKSTFFILFIFAIGYGVGPQFVAGLGKEGRGKSASRSIVLVFCLMCPVLCAKLAGLDLGYAAGMYAGSQTISASIGVCHRPDRAAGPVGGSGQDSPTRSPIGYAVTYIFGTIGSAIILAQLGPKLIGVDLVQACKDVRKSGGWRRGGAAPVSSRPIAATSSIARLRRPAAELTRRKPVMAMLPGLRVFVERVRRGGAIERRGCADGSAGRRRRLGLGAARAAGREASPRLHEVEDPELLDPPARSSTSSSPTRR